jgi:hypothetical protein
VTILVIGATQCFLACTFHSPEVVPALTKSDLADAGIPIGAR